MSDQQDGSGPGTAIPVDNEQAISAWLRRSGGQASFQTTHVDGGRRYRGLQVICADGQRRRIWFDVTGLPDDQGPAERVRPRSVLRALFSR